MTSPSGPSNFEYSDDSVVARLSFEVPPQALTDVTQLTQALSAAATQQEYLSRSTGTWLDYMNQVPLIMERANQAYRESITQMERMAYIQNEMGGGQANVGPSGGDGGGGQYSTQAPQGYVNPFQGMQFGMGVTPDLQSAQQQIMGMAAQNPAMYANIMGARGNAVNPALMGAVGGAAAGYAGQAPQSGGGAGMGGPPPASQSPQGTQAGRNSAAPPDHAQGGAPTGSEPQNIPAEPHPDAPAWQHAVSKAIAGAQQIVNEGQQGSGGRSRVLGAVGGGLSAAAAGMNAMGGGAGGNASGRLSSIAKGVGLAGAVGGGAWLASKVQDVGEQIQQYQQIGSVQGGDAGTGMKYEAQARLLALNPFITSSQARQAMQMALSSGFQGGEYDTVMDYMLSNFEEMGVNFSTSMKLARAGLESGQTMGEATSTSTELLAMMEDLARDGGASFHSRQQQVEELVPALTAMGFDPESASRAAIGFQEGYGDNMALRDSISRIGGQAAASPLLTQMAAQRAGISGNFLPGAQKAALSEAGVDADELLEMAAAQVAEYCKGYPDRLNRIAAFQALMGEQGVQLDWNQAEALYDKVTGEEKPSERANRRVSETNKTRDRPLMENIKEFGSSLAAPFTKGPVGALASALQGDWKGAWDDLTTNPFASDPDPGEANKDNFARAGRAPKDPPSTPQEAQAQASAVRTEGTVQGEVRITVDQSGRVSAPSTIQLSGQQKNANAGYGNAQLNNGSPADPAHGHAFTGWGN